MPQQRRGAPLGPGEMGWRRLHTKPPVPNEIRTQISILDEMQLEEGKKYLDKDGRVRRVLMFRYPLGCISKFTQYRGSEHYNRQGIVVDNREYKTPHEGTTDRCFIVSAIVRDDGKYKPYSVYEPAIFAEKMGWRRTTGKLEPLPDDEKLPEVPSDLKVEMKMTEKRKMKEKILKEKK